MTSRPMRRGAASWRRRTTPRPEPEPSTADPAHPVCPDCGHHTSAWVGGGCTVLRPATDVEVAAGWPWLVECGHDCTVSLHGESARDRLAGTLGRVAQPPQQPSTINGER